MYSSTHFQSTFSRILDSAYCLMIAQEKCLQHSLFGNARHIRKHYSQSGAEQKTEETIAICWNWRWKYVSSNKHAMFRLCHATGKLLSFITNHHSTFHSSFSDIRWNPCFILCTLFILRIIKNNSFLIIIACHVHASK